MWCLRAVAFFTYSVVSSGAFTFPASRTLLASPLNSALSISGGSGPEWGDVFEQISESRYANKHFAAKPVPPKLIEKLLIATQRSPTSFNTQPYKALVVTNDSTKHELAKCMLGPNSDRVIQAGASIVFCADQNVPKDKNKHMELMAKAGVPEGYRKKLPLYVSVFSSGAPWLLQHIPFVFKRLAFGIARRLGFALPAINSPEAWAMKNTMLAAEALMLAATAYGLTSCPMEGFDPRRLRKRLKIPRRYSVPVVISLGYPAKGHTVRKSPRYPLADLFFSNEWGTSVDFATPSAAAGTAQA